MKKINNSLERVITEFKSNIDTQEPLVLDLADLMMLQASADFDTALELITKYDGSKQSEEAINNIISEAKDELTNPDTFKNSVDKTINIQLDESHLSTKEETQNHMDSYNLSDSKKPIDFLFNQADYDYYKLEGSDKGIGMTMPEAIKYYSIPFNTTKEFDPTKIGTKGIGAFSYKDFADFILLETSKKGSSQLNKLLFYKENDDWKIMIGQKSQKNTRKKFSTKITGFIPVKKTSEDKLRKFMFQYVGMLKEDRAQVSLNKKRINTLRKNYLVSEPINVLIDNIESPMIMGTSIKKDNDDELRNYYSSEILMIQDPGLYIKYRGNPFDEKSLHYELLENLTDNGFKFFIEVPEKTSFVKGRNNFIPEHEPAILEGSYKAFESLVLNVLLSNNGLKQDHSSLLLKKITDIFERNYTEVEKRFTYQNYSKWDRTKVWATNAAYDTIEISKEVLKGIRDGFSGIYKYVKNNQKEWNEKTIDSFKTLGMFIGTKAIPFLGAASALTYGTIKLYEAYGLTPFIAAAGAITAPLAILKGPKLINNVIQYVNESLIPSLRAKEKSSSEEKPEPKPKKEHKSFYEGYVQIMKKVFGLYTDIEGKRERKIAKLNKSIAKKYVSSMHTNDFWEKIMSKDFIDIAKYELITNNNEENENIIKTIMDRSKNNKYTYIPTSDYVKVISENSEEFIITKFKSVYKKENTKISIEDLIELFINKELKHDLDFISYYDEKESFYHMPRYNNNPVVSKVLHKLERTELKTKNKYNVKVFEEKLDYVTKVAGESLTCLYLMTPIGLGHLLIQELSHSKKNILKDRYIFKKISESWKKDKLERLKKKQELLEQKEFEINYDYKKPKVKEPKVKKPKVKKPKVKKPKEIKETKSFSEIKSDIIESIEYKLSEIKDFWVEEYRKSWINDKFGLLAFDLYTLKKLNYKKIEKIVNFSGKGEIYLDLFNINTKLDEICSEALGVSQFRDISVDKNSSEYDYHGETIWLDQKNRINYYITTPHEYSRLTHGYESEKLNSLIKRARIINNSESNDIEKMGYDYGFLDEIIHLKTHQVLGSYVKNDDAESDDIKYELGGIHNSEFYEKKNDLRRKVVDYILEHKINISEEIDSIITNNPEKLQNYQNTINIGRLNAMTDRGLRMVKKEAQVKSQN